MKYWMITLTLILSTGVFAQDLDCKKFKYGTFEMKIQGPDNRYFTIKRKGKTQTELESNTNLKVKFKVNWIDQCTYTLIYEKTLKEGNGEKIPFSKDNIVTVKIIETYTHSYLQKTSMTGSDIILKTKIFKLK